MSQGDRSAVGIDPIGVKSIPLADVGQALRGEGFVELNDVNVAPCDPCAVQGLVGRLHRGDPEHIRVHSGRAP